MTAALRKRARLAVSLAACGTAALLLSGCSGSGALACSGSPRYANSRSIGPWRIPDDLSAPKEADALQIPAVPGQNAPSNAGAAGSGAPCLDSPPTFHEQDDQAAPQPRPRATPAQGGSGERPRRGSRRRRERDDGP